MEDRKMNAPGFPFLPNTPTLFFCLSFFCHVSCFCECYMAHVPFFPEGQQTRFTVFQEESFSAEPRW